MNICDAEQLAQMLGIPAFRTTFFLPEYPDGEAGAWRLSRTATGIDYGYYTRQWIISGMPVLLRRNRANPEMWDTWMSLTPHEMESQEPGCLYAHGYTVVMGMGMGWIAINAALNPDVRRVTVVELDAEVIGLFNSSGILNQVAPEIASKIVIVHANALEWRPDETVDFLYADIWRPIADSNALGDVRRMQRNIRARQVYFWGQELRLYTAFRQFFGPDALLTEGGVERCVAEVLKLPLLLPWGDGYLEKIGAVVRNRFERGLPMEEAD